MFKTGYEYITSPQGDEMRKYVVFKVYIKYTILIFCELIHTVQYYLILRFEHFVDNSYDLEHTMHTPTDHTPVL